MATDGPSNPDLFSNAALPAVDGFADSHILAAKKLKYSNYYDHKIDEIRAFFDEENFEVADVLFDYLLELKEGKIRKNGYIPDHGHEIDQLLPLITSLKNGELSEKRAEVEAQYGSVEKWICGTIGHDIGEDFNVFPQDLVDELQKRLIAKHGAVSEKNEALVQRAKRSMERLTHYRKFSFENFVKLTGVNLETLDTDIRPGETIPMEEFKPFFADRTQVLSDNIQNLQVFATWEEDRNEPRIIVTRYGMSPESISPENQQLGSDWYLYIMTLLKSGVGAEDDPFDFLVKMNDRVHGLSTRIAIIPFSARSLDHYLDLTELLFSDLDAANLFVNHLYKDSPLSSTALSIDRMMKAAYTGARIFNSFHPDIFVAGGKGISIDNLEQCQDGIKVSLIRLQNCGEYMNEFYGLVDRESYPPAMQLRDFRNVRQTDLRPSHAFLYDMIRAAYAECGPETRKHIIKPEALIGPDSSPVIPV